MSREEPPMSLDDLRIVRRCSHGAISACATDDNRRAATLDDLIQVLEGMGAKRVLADYDEGSRFDILFDGDWDPGTYLVLRLEDE